MINRKVFRFRLSKQSTLLASGILFFLLLAWFLNSRIAGLTKENLKNSAALNQVLPGFNEQALKRLKEDITRLEAQLLALAYLFDPPQKQLKEDYDLPIYFIEELSNIKRALKMKSGDKKVSYPDLGFKETLPDEKEARYLLKQLYVFREVVNRGVDCGLNFNSVTPLPSEDSGISPGVKVAKARAEFTASVPALMEFLIQTSELAPLDSIETILLKSEDSIFKADMTLSHILIEDDWKDKRIPFTPLNMKDIFGSQEKFINILRVSNPFSSLKPPEAQEELPAQAGGEPKKLARFLYRGKAVLKTKEVAVIEDTLSQETVFLSLQEKIGDFILKELQDVQIILKNINNGQEIIIKREEE